MDNSNIVPDDKTLGKTIIDRAFVPLIIVLVGVLAYGLGRYGKLHSETEAVTISTEVGLPDGSPTSKLTSVPTPSESPTSKKEGIVVASKNGSKYHLTNCPGAQQIKKENKIQFESSVKAEEAGYTPAANCPGLK